MGKYFTSMKSMLILAIILILVMVLFNAYDLMYDKTDKVAYDKESIESLEVELININTADKDELCNLPGVSEATAQSIIDYRKENGDFKTIEEIQNVKGIGEKDFINIRPLITV